MKTNILVAIALIASLAACAQPGSNGFGITKQTGGAILGGVAGGAVGSQIGKGNGNIAATIVGTLAGAALGSEVGSSLDRADTTYAQQQRQYQQQQQQQYYTPNTRGCCNYDPSYGPYEGNGYDVPHRNWGRR